MGNAPLIAHAEPIAGAASANACGDPGATDCFECSITPFCNDADCCDAVCFIDPFCCQEEWDCFCAGGAVAVCTCDPGQAPPNDDCSNAIPIELGSTPVTNVCATVGGPSHANCNDFFLTGLGLDVWYSYVADFTGQLTVSTCNSVDPSWDTQIAVYQGCNCGALSDPPLACNNDALGCSFGSSKVPVNVVAGGCYLIRLGSSLLGPSGNGTLNLNPPCILDNEIPGDAVPEPETCGANTNGGCDNDPPDQTFTTLNCGDAIHGTAWAAGLVEDTDWYAITVSEPTLVTVGLESEFESLLSIAETDPLGSADCTDVTGGSINFQNGLPCSDTTMLQVLTAGTWLVKIGVGGFEGVPCDFTINNKNDYVLTVTCQEPCFADISGDSIVNANDLAALLGNWGSNPGHPADLNGDGVVNASDLAAMLGFWGSCGDPCVVDAQCDDGLPCNGAETCLNGICKAGTPVDCDDANICTADTCDDATGLCVYNPVDCSDGNACTTDLCGGAVGCFHVAVGCDDGDACTIDTCDPQTGCIFDLAMCDDGNPCTDDVCDSGSGCIFTVNDANNCDDANPCNGKGVCLNGECKSDPLDCDDGNACTNDGCDPVAGCMNQPINCDDGILCTTDSCDPAVGCVYNVVDCDDGDACTSECPGISVVFTFDMDGAQQVPPSGSPGLGFCTVILNTVTGFATANCSYEGLAGDVIAAHIHGPSPEGVNAPIIISLAVSGGTTGTASGSGTLLPSQIQDMLDGLHYINVHTFVFPPGEIRGQITGMQELCCDPQSGCVHEPTDCDDGDLCTTDSCDSVGGCLNEPLSCDDGDACTIDLCDPASGCIHEAVVCDDGNVCTADGCDPASGCVHTFTDCDDGDACTDECVNPSTIFTLPLDGTQQAPPIESPGSGTCTVVLDTNSGFVTANCTYQDLSSDAVAAHIHGLAPPGLNAPVLVPLTVSGGQSGTATGSGTLAPAQIQGMLDGLTYVNIHSQLFPPGEIRGQIVGGSELCCNPVTGCESGPVDCDDGNDCTVDSCDPATGCVNDAVGCDDGDACTIDNCDPDSGGCFYEPVDCDDGNACTIDSCDPASGCVHEAPQCDDGDPCTFDSCDEQQGCTNEPIVCDDGDPCTVDSCLPGVGCVGDPVDCEDGNLCTIDTCDAALGCVHSVLDCEDGDPCSDNCPGAFSVFSFSLDGDQQVPPANSSGTGTCTVMLDEVSGFVIADCEFDGLSANAISAHIHGLSPPGQNAPVLVPLTVSGATSGTASGSGILSAAEIQGMLDGLTYVNIHSQAFPPGEIRGQVLNQQPLCCNPQVGCVDLPADCDDGDLCTADSCDPAIGCVNEAISCDDGDICTADGCDPATGCTHGPVNCEDGLLCTTDTCDPALGCVQQLRNCDDGDACTDECSGGNLVFDFALEGGQQVPPSGSPGTGNCMVTLNTTTGFVAAYCTYDGLMGDAFQAHIHGPGPPGMNAPIVIGLSVSGGTTGTASGSGLLVPRQVQDMVDGLNYINVHSFVFPPGEIRGQIVGGTVLCCNPETGCESLPTDCDDGDPCTEDGCDPATGCTQQPANCDDGNACTTDGCDPASGCTHDPVNCDDGDACNGVETCDPASGCGSGTPLVCDNGDFCDGVETCDPASGCVAGEPPCPADCDEATDTCLTPDCPADVNGDNVINASDLAIILGDWNCEGCSADVNGDGVVGPADLAAALGGWGPCPQICETAAECDDGKFCTGVEVCVDMLCQAGPPPSCSDGDPCTADLCNPSTDACENPPVDCSDGDPCTVETCDPPTGDCLQDPVDCDDGDLCSVDSCDPASGCVNTPIECDPGDVCVDGVCVPGP